MPRWEPHRLARSAYPEPGLDLPVLYADLDVNGHLNNVALGRFFEHSRATVYAQNGFWQAAHAEGGRSFVVRVAIDYVKEVHLGSTLHVRSRLVRVGTSSATIEQAAWVGDECVGLAEVVFAHARDGGSAPWPPGAAELLERLRSDAAALRA